MGKKNKSNNDNQTSQASISSQSERVRFDSISSSSYCLDSDNTLHIYDITSYLTKDRSLESCEDVTLDDIPSSFNLLSTQSEPTLRVHNAAQLATQSDSILRGPNVAANKFGKVFFQCAELRDKNFNQSVASLNGEEDESKIDKTLLVEGHIQNGNSEVNIVAKGKDKGKNTPKTSTSGRASKPSAAHSATSVTDLTNKFDPDKLRRDAPEYIAAVTSLTRHFKGQFLSLTIPCCVASGKTGNPGELQYSVHNTLYLDVHCPAVKPPVVVISDGGRRTVDFGDVSIGQTVSRSVTVQNISDKRVTLKASATNPHGPFDMLNSLRDLNPGATHTILLTFVPTLGRIFQEELCIRTVTSILHLTLRGRGVSPMTNLSVENGLFDMMSVLVGEYVEKPFKIQNTSTLAIDYVIKQDSLSPLRYHKQQEIPPFLLNNREVKNFVGTQNDSGKNVFDIIPTTGTIQAGETKEIMMTFAPDHESDLYSDGVRIELFDQEESHFFQVIGQAKSRVMFLEGQDPLIPGIESLGLEVTYVEEEDAADGAKKDKAKSGPFTSPAALVTIQSVISGDTFKPGTREIYAGCVRTMAVSQKKPGGKTNGEFSLEGIQGLLQKGFSIEPQRGMVEAGAKKAITFTWTPPAGFDPSKTIEETATLTVRCDVTEQIPLMIRAMVISE